jgi:type I restriction enzyme M protein
MVDASKGFIKEGPKNRLRSQDIHRIVDTFTNAREIPRYSRAVPIAEIADPANDYNLNIPRYIDSSEPEDLHDLTGHLAGGIPTVDVDALERYWRIMPGLRATLFAPGPRPGYSAAVVAPREVTAAVTARPEFLSFADRVRAATDAWAATHRPALTAIAVNDRPRELIAALSEDLLARLADLPLLDPYDAYQCLMDYWAETMQDDVYLIAADGWTAAARPRTIIEDKERKIKESADLTVAKKKFKMDLIPPSLLEARFFADHAAHLAELTAAADTAEAHLTEYVEEHAGDEGLLSDVVNDKGKIVKADLKARLKAISDDPEFEDEREALSRAQALADRAAATGRAVKEARATLDRMILERYGTLTEEEIKSLVVDDKWLSSIAGAIDREVQQIARGLADRVKDLTERYAVTLPELEAEVETLSAKVEGHIRKMGVTW